MLVRKEFPFQRWAGGWTSENDFQLAQRTTVKICSLHIQLLRNFSDDVWFKVDGYTLLYAPRACTPRLHCYCDKAACTYFVAAICCTNSNQFEFVRQIAVPMNFTCHMRRFVVATCLSDVLQRFFASCVLAFRCNYTCTWVKNLCLFLISGIKKRGERQVAIVSD